MQNLKVYGFYDEWENKSKKIIRDLLEEITLNFPHVECTQINIVANKEMWHKFRLKTIPGVVITNNDLEICFFAGKIQKEKVLNFIKGYTKSNITIMPPLNYFITASSTCHRYERWNETFLQNKEGNVGWSSTSSSTPRAEYLTLCLEYEATITQIDFYPRENEYNDDLKNSFPNSIDIFYSFDAENWQYNGHYEIVMCDDQHAVVNTEIFNTRYIKIVFNNYNLRLEGKYFTQIRRIILRGIKHYTPVPFVCGSLCGTFLNDVVNKRGLFSGNDVAVSLWYFVPEQQLQNRISYNSTIMLIALSGTFSVTCDGQVCNIDSSKWMIIPAENVHQIKNIGPDNGVILEIKDNNDSCSVWEGR